MFEEKIEAEEVRKQLYEKLEMHGEEYLYEDLKQTDEETYHKIPPGKIRRVIRALEVYYSTGKKISEFQKEKTTANFETVQIGIMHDRKILYQRINERVDRMIDEGLLDEAKRFKDEGFDYKKYYSLDTVGLKEVFKYYDGEYNYEEMVEEIKKNTRRYAKRQLTWFRKDKRIHWINAEDFTGEEEIVDEAVRLLVDSETKLQV